MMLLLLVALLGAKEVGWWGSQRREGGGGDGVFGRPRPRLPDEGDFGGGNTIVDSARGVGHGVFLGHEPSEELVILVDHMQGA